MFVEIVRLFIVFLTTAAGHALGLELVEANPDNGAVVGATLGACVGYVAGGAFGRLLRQAMGLVEEQADKLPPARLLAGIIGGTLVAALTTFIGLPGILLIPLSWVRWPILGVLVWVGAYEGFRVAARKSDQLLALAGLSTRPLVSAMPYLVGDAGAVLLDTSAVIDGRPLQLAKTGFLQGALLVPRFVLDELQAIADAQDPARRRRGRRGLEVLDALQRLPETNVQILDDEMVEHHEVDAKLVALARRLRVPLMTCDGPLSRVAELQGVKTMNLHHLAEGLRPEHQPGEVLTIPITRAGREPGQGVGYLDDGTMVVVADAADKVGEELAVRVTGNSQTAVGRMLFASIADG